VLIPILYLKGISTGDFEEALIALLGKDAGGLSASIIGRPKEAWSEEHRRSGGVEYPHDTPPYPFMPSPTFGLSSVQAVVP